MDSISFERPEHQDEGVVDHLLLLLLRRVLANVHKPFDLQGTFVEIEPVRKGDLIHNNAPCGGQPSILM